MSKIGYTRNFKSAKPEKRILFIALLAIVAFVALTGLNPLSAQPQEEYKGAGYCANCHVEEMLHYTESPHTHALSNPEFQKTWKDLGSDAECLECHTTGYDQETETYAAPEVSCEACHGPGDTMNRDTSPELCGTCHSGPFPTYEEWQNSGPSHGEAGCISCHDMHTSELIYGTPTATCGECHDTHVTDVSLTAHGENGVEGIDCHMEVKEANFYTGLRAETGHSFEFIGDCSSCHNRQLKKHDVLGEQANACLSCHGDIHELKLKLVNGDVYPLEEPVKLCAQCHNERYTAWAEGTHGSPDNPEAVCTECHNPHNPVINNISTLDPIPAREYAPPSTWLAKMALIVLLEIFGFGVWINWSDK